MSFRARLQLAFAGLAVASVAGLSIAVRYEMARRLTDEHRRRVEALKTVIRDDLSRESRAISARLATLASALADDNRFRLALGGSAAERSYLLEYAGNAMRLAGLDMLQLQDEGGRILSSGQFRNEFDRLERGLPASIHGTADSVALIEARSPEGTFLVLASARDARVAGQVLGITGGIAVGREFLDRLTPDRDLQVVLEYPGGMLAAGEGPPENADVETEELPIPFVVAAEQGANVSEARFIIRHALTPVAALERGVVRWSVAAGVLSVIAAVALGTWLASLLSRPLTDLAGKTATLDLNRLDVDFASDRTDEVGAFSRLLAAMTERLRRGAQQLRDAERRATIGDLARQVNHDVKNGLVPIRNVLRHLAEVAEGQPGELTKVFKERKSTLDSGVQYLETLAANYARLSPRLEGGRVDIAGVVEQVVRGAASNGARLRVDLAAGLPPLRGDPVVVRRILENLVGNAIDAVEVGEGSEGSEVVVAAEAASLGGRSVRITVRDRGPGMSAAELERAFEDFYTTKPGGTGLGLSIVRRLVADLEGSLKVQTEPGEGTTVEVTLPSA